MTRAAGLLSIGAGVAFVLTVLYLLTVLSSAGLTFDMFDDDDALMAWVGGHVTLYGVLYLLYFVAQLLFLPVPVLFALAAARAGTARPTTNWIAAAFGVLSVPLASASIAAVYGGARSSVTEQVDVGATTIVADVGKYLRLLSEVPLGLWFVLSAVVLIGVVRAGVAARVGCAVLAVVGVWTVVVALWKMYDPFVSVEDWVAFPIALAQIGFGVALIRWRRDSERPAPRDGSG